MYEKGVKWCRNFFLPTEDNHNFPLSFSHIPYFSYLIIGALLLVAYPVYYHTSPFAAVSTLIRSFEARELIDLINNDRTVNHLKPLVNKDNLESAAKKKAADMLEKQYFSHTTPDNQDSWFFFTRENYNFWAAGENLAIDFVSAAEAHNALMRSRGHRANILNPIYKDIGIGIKSGIFEGSPTILVVQFFGAEKTKIAPMVQILPEQKETKIVTKTASPIATVSTQKQKIGVETQPIIQIKKHPVLGAHLSVSKIPLNDLGIRTTIEIISAALMSIILVSFVLTALRLGKIKRFLVLKTLLIVVIFGYISFIGGAKIPFPSIDFPPASIILDIE